MIRFMSRVLANDIILMDTPSVVGKWLVWIDTDVEHLMTFRLWEWAQRYVEAGERLANR